ncbi:MAG: mannose-6-phosphate isomerase, class I [Ilumatobacteraceae bacterium]
MHVLHGTVAHYEWGDKEALPDFLGALTNGKPWAELWFGTHPGGPSQVTTTTGTTPLSDVVGNLSFLVKVIAAAEPLSLQTHPTTEQAREGFARENARGIPLDAAHRIYRDASAKPELLIALSRFEAVSGFRDVTETLELFARHNWRDLATRLSRDGIEGFVRFALGQSRHELPTNLPDYAARLAEHYPGSGGVLISLPMHHVVLEAGQALFLDAGNVHSYLSGFGVEVMSSSDNVVRAAFTRKHVDAEEFMRVSNFTPMPPPIVNQARNDDRIEYFAPTRAFGVQRIDGDKRVTVRSTHAAEIVLCVSGGDETLHKGQACLLRHGESLTIDEPASVFRCWG